MDAKEQEYQTQVKAWLEVLKAAREAIKSATLVNGGAAVALLAFLGRGAKDDKALGMACAMMIFAVGVFLAAVAAGGMYCTQWCYAREKWEKSRRETVGDRWRHVTIFFVAGSYISFLVGAWRAYYAFVG